MSQEVSPLGSFSLKTSIIFLNFQRMMTRFLLHNLTLPAKEETGYIKVWGQRRLTYLKHYRKVLYYNLLTSGKLRSHLADTEEQAQQLFSGWQNNMPKKKTSPKNSNKPICVVVSKNE